MTIWDLPSGWEWKPIAAIAEDTDRRNPQSTPTMSFQYVDIGSIDNENGVIKQDEIRTIEGANAPSRARKVIRKSDVVFATTRPSLRNIALVPASLDNQICSRGFCVLRAKEDLAEPRYLYFACRTSFFINQLIPKQRGASYPAVTDNDVYATLLPVPYPNESERSLAEQRRIVARIEALLAEVRECRLLHTQITQGTNQLMNAVLIEIFKDIEQQFPGEQQIGSITNVTSGGTPTRSRSEYYQGSIPWIKTGELKDNTIYEAEDYITEEAIENSNAKIYPVNTLLIAMYGQGQTRGRTGLLGIEAASNQACCAIYPAPARFNSEYLQFWFRSKYTRLRQESESRGGNQSNLNQSMIKSLTPPLPPIPRQVEVAEQLKQIECEIQEMYETESKDEILLLEIEQSILAQAFRGEL